MIEAAVPPSAAATATTGAKWPMTPQIGMIKMMPPRHQVAPLITDR